MNNAPRIALYSHDTMGLGHIRRTSLLARALRRPPLDARVLLLSGIRESGAYPLPDGIDSITLPAYRKHPDGSYGARALGVSLERLIALRSATLAAALDAFAPDVFIVDNVARGALGELDDSLARQHARGCRIVLGLRDIIDEPEAVARQWEKLRTLDTIRAYYDAVWIYGDARLYDTARAYNIAAADKPITYLGYPDPLLREERHAPSNEAPYALCLLGGGQDGYALAAAFARATLPAGWQAILLTGAMMPAAERAQLAALVADRPEYQLHDFTPEPLALMQNARAIVAMSGYNTTLELLVLNKPMLLVPRVKPRLEQWLRASRLAELGLADCLHPDDLSPARISDWLDAIHHKTPLPCTGPMENTQCFPCVSDAGEGWGGGVKNRVATTAPCSKARDQLDFNGLDRLNHETLALLTQGNRP